MRNNKKEKTINNRNNHNDQEKQSSSIDSFIYNWTRNSAKIIPKIIDLCWKILRSRPINDQHSLWCGMLKCLLTIYHWNFGVEHLCEHLNLFFALHADGQIVRREKMFSGAKFNEILSLLCLHSVYRFRLHMKVKTSLNNYSACTSDPMFRWNFLSLIWSRRRSHENVFPLIFR